jgi:hypothetical protein
MLAKRACRSPPTQHRAARLVGTGRPQKKPAEAGRRGGHESQDDGVGPCASNGAPGLGDHFGISLRANVGNADSDPKELRRGKLGTNRHRTSTVTSHRP